MMTDGAGSERRGSAAGVVGTLAGAALAATGAITATGFVTAADGAVVASSPWSEETLLDYVHRLLDIADGSDLGRLAHHVHHVLSALIAAWPDEFLTAGGSVLPLLLILVAQRKRPPT